MRTIIASLSNRVRIRKNTKKKVSSSSNSNGGLGCLLSFFVLLFR